MTTHGEIEKAMARIERVRSMIGEVADQAKERAWLDLAKLSVSELKQMEELLSQERGETLSPEQEAVLDGLFLRALQVEQGRKDAKFMSICVQYVGKNQEVVSSRVIRVPFPAKS